MTPTQIVIYLVLILLIFFYLRRWWMARSIPRYTAQQASERLKQGSAILLDVRSKTERSNSHIKGSLHIPLQELRRHTNDLQKYREKEIICYCQTGSRSLVAAARLMKQGFRVGDMTGGISEWNFSQLK